MDDSRIWIPFYSRGMKKACPPSLIGMHGNFFAAASLSTHTCESSLLLYCIQRGKQAHNLSSARYSFSASFPHSFCIELLKPVPTTSCQQSIVLVGGEKGKKNEEVGAEHIVIFYLKEGCMQPLFIAIKK